MGQTASKQNEIDWHPAKLSDSEHTVHKMLHPNQVETPDGVFVWKVDDMDRLTRFLFLGSDSMYSPTNKHPQRKYVECIDRLIAEGRGEDVVQRISDISSCGRAPRQNYIIFALAICARSNDIETKKKAYKELCQICRIPTHFFLFVSYCKQESGQYKGWGRAHRRAINQWYEEKCKNPVNIGRLLTKYKSRKIDTNGKTNERWSHTDIFRLSHPSSDGDLMEVVRQYVLNGYQDAQHFADQEGKNNDNITKFLSYIKGTEDAKRCTDEDDLVELIKSYKLEREHVPTQMMHSRKVCEALIMNMKTEAKLRNMCMISAKGLCGEKSEVEKEIVKTLSDKKILHGERVHPVRVLLALMSYEKGEKLERSKSKNGKFNTMSLKWEVNKNVVEALNSAYYLSFDSVKPTGKRYLLAVNVSDKMKVPCIGCPAIKCHMAAAAMMMTTVRTETKCKIVGFSDGLTRIDIDRGDTLSQVLQKMDSLQGEKADSALPMLWAKEKKKKIDVFIVYTDNVPTCGQVHASQALVEYREKIKIPDAKLIVVAMAANEFTVADPAELDHGMINIVGFDVNAAVLIAKFSHGKI